jgi:hypothetical protein
MDIFNPLLWRQRELPCITGQFAEFADLLVVGLWQDWLAELIIIFTVDVARRRGWTMLTKSKKLRRFEESTRKEITNSDSTDLLLH